MWLINKNKSKAKKSSFSRVARLRAIVVILLVANIGGWSLIFTRAATPAQVRFVYVYAADQAYDANSYSMVSHLASDISGFYRGQVGKPMNIASVGTTYHMGLTVNQFRTCPAGASCPYGAQQAIYENLYRSSQIKVPNMETLVITQFNRGDGVNCGMGTYNPTGSATAGGVVTYATAACQSYIRVLTTAAHEMGHGFGLSRSSAGGTGHSADGSLMDASTATTQCDNNWAACFLDAGDRSYLQSSPFFNVVSTPIYTGISVNRKSPSNYQGLWIDSTNGQVINKGNASWYGDLKDKSYSGRVVDIISPDYGGGYWIITSTGRVYNFAYAGFYGDETGKSLSASIVGAAPQKGGFGYWLVGSDGGVFTFGSAKFYGSMGGQHINAPMVGMAAYPPGTGYWLVGSDGGVFTFGSAKFYGSMGGQHINAPIIGMAANLSGTGYWLVGTDGGVYTFGTNIGFYGSAVGKLNPGESVTDMDVTTGGKGYYLITNQNRLLKFGDAT